jgi:hypothetical protein
MVVLFILKMSLFPTTISLWQSVLENNVVSSCAEEEDSCNQSSVTTVFNLSGCQGFCCQPLWCCLTIWSVLEAYEIFELS